ncbi:glycosyltransferase family 4 protein [Aliivibrio kagoshimensis]|uniref:glycosyltransferase family 4 protein n=1 Tax=Aliivibrio kagoshimensis TaxID=2910230 RepID=UPI003D1260AA
MKQTIWLLIDSRHFGGIESHILQLAKALQQEQHPVHIIFLKKYPEKHPLATALSKAGLPYISLHNTFSGLNQLLKSSPPSIMHTHGYKAGIVGRLMGIIHSVPVISSFHAGENKQGKLAIYDLIDRYSSFLSTQRIAVSEPIAHSVPFKTTVINNFLSNVKQPISQGGNVAFVGRLSYEKGADRILTLAKNMPQTHFDIYGDGPEREMLQHAATDNVTFHGQQDMSKQWSNVGVLLMPSRFEGLPMAAIEAMARGIPVIGFNVGSLNKLIKNENNGWLIPDQRVLLFQDALFAYLNQLPTQRRQYQQAAQKTVRQGFSDQAILPQLLNLYRVA